MRIDFLRNSKINHIIEIQTEGLRRVWLAVSLLVCVCVICPEIIAGKAPVADEKIVEAPDTLTARKAFAELPVKVLDLLSRSKRLDMLDYYDADSLLKASNTLGGPSQLITVRPNYLKVSLTPVSTLEVCILPRKGRAEAPLVMTIYTIGGKNEAPDSEINFFDSGMQQLKTSAYFKIPEMKEFFRIPKQSGVKGKELEQEIAFPTIQYTAEPDNPYRMSGRLTVDCYLPEELRDKIKPYISRPLIWTWDGRKWNKTSGDE